MKIEIRDTVKNPVLSRDEIKADIFFDSKTPSRLDIHKEMAKKLGVKENLVVVKKIITLFGEPKAEAVIYKYEKEEIMQRLEPEYLKKKHQPKKKEEKPAEEKKTEEPKAEEKPAVKEEKKEDKKPADKK